ncbi:MAG: oxidoreductase [Kineosporiaceae bacterium]
MLIHDPVLITGCSSGIGRASATALLEAGFTVYATARKPKVLRDLADAGAHTLALDVTDEASMAAAVAHVEARHGHVGALVNNAGYGAYGPIEEVPLDAVRRQFETNLFGLGRLCQLVLPGMRAAGRGRIVNIGSMGGRATFPTGGWYHASKYAVEALSDALRIEVAPFGVDVVLVEPGLIRTSFEDVAGAGLEAQVDGPYGPLRQTSREVTARNYAGRGAVGPEAVAAVVVESLSSGHPRSRYVITPQARAILQMRRLAGDRVWDATLRKIYRWA